MKIFTIKDFDLQPEAELRSNRKFSVMPTPIARATQLLLAALDTVNQAGLDGKKLTEITVLEICTPTRDQDRIEIHAKVEHRLRPSPPERTTK